MRGVGGVTLAVIVAATTGVAASSAASYGVGSNAVGSNAAEGMVLAASDFPQGATVLSQVAAPAATIPHASYTSAYTRTFSEVQDNGNLIDTLDAAAIDYSSAATPSKFMGELILAASSTTSRALLLADATKSLGTSLAAAKVKVVSSQLVRAHVFDVAGGNAVDIVFRFATSRAVLWIGEIYVRLGAALEQLLYTTPAPGLTEAEDTSLARRVATRIKESLLPPPVIAVPPTITGTLSPGDVLTASTGTWSGTSPATTTYAYQWYVCNSQGQQCAGIAAATTSTYTVSFANAGYTLYVSVTATTPAGSATAVSQTSAAVS